MLFDLDPNDQEEGLRLIEDLTANADRIQQQVLQEILIRNSKTDYLRGFLNGLSDRSRFKKTVPVVDYEQIKPYIDRIANGEPSSIISAQPITELLTSSGTSGGQPKIMPTTAEELVRKTFFYNLLVPVMNHYVQGLDQGKAMYLLFVKPEMTTPSGLPARPVLTSYYKSSHFRNRPYNKYNVYTSPDDTILCSDSKQSMHCQLLCGLLQRHDVLRVGAIFASAFLRAVKYLEDHWQELCSNISRGFVSDWVTDQSCRAAVAKILRRPEPELARLVEQECSNTPWEGIIRRLWPKTKFIDVIVTGSMAQYLPLLEFYGGGLPLVSTMYGSSECYFGINFKPLCSPSEVSYTLLPNMAYFEFLAVETSDEEDDQVEYGRCNGGAKLQQRVVDLVDVEIGRCYELVVTTFTGLYRYRVGDILKVTGFHNAAPQFRFMQRRNVVLSVDTDKTSEEDLLRAVSEAKLLLHPHGFFLSEYTSYAHTSSLPGHYVLFWELKPRRSPQHDPCQLDPAIMELCCAAVERRLDAVYRRCRRKDGSVGPLEIRVVRCGAFDALMDLCVSKGSSVNQYKTPRCIKSPAAIELLEGMVVGRFFSRELPQWEPSGFS